MTDKDAEFLAERVDFSSFEIKTCPWCGSHEHEEPCPNVRAIDYYEDGSVKRVEFRT